MFSNLDDFAPVGVESGVGLALRDESNRYLFFLAGTRHHCPPGELFYAGIGGHQEPGEDWIDCAEREAREEIGSGVSIIPSPDTWYLPRGGAAERVHVSDQPRPLALYEMIHPEGTPRAGDLYRLVIYRARLTNRPRDLPSEEISGVLALTISQVVKGLDRCATLGQLLEEDAAMVLEPDEIDRQTHLYPLGTAVALARVLKIGNIKT
ncbi:MAG: NUDIX hydrolase [Candidatus Promineifilaceae bacterium]